jgi:brefeldin A-resistance guanine nucleotide exchange factor 1
VTADNYESAVGLANDFISAGSVGYIEERQRDAASRRSKGVKPSKPSENEVVARGVKAIGLIYHLTNRVPTLIKQSHLEEREGTYEACLAGAEQEINFDNAVAWSAYWSPVFQSLSAQCINPCRDIRHHAVSTLQRCLLSVHIDSTDDKEWTAIFDQVLFPLILLLLKPEVYHSDPLGMSETRVQAATLVCKIFLRYLDQLPNREGMLDLWLKILDILDRMMNSGQGDSLAEAIPESLKNILLVMADGGHLVPPSQDSSKEPIWTETKKRLERFLPDLFKEIFPEDLNEKPAAVSAASSPISPRDDANATDASVGESQPMPGQSESEGEVEVIKPETKTD